MTRRWLVRLCALLAALTLAACTSSAGGAAKPSELNDNPGNGPFLGSEVSPAQPRPQFTLTDTAGKQFAFGTATSGHPTLLYFGYTECPDVCPLTMANAMLALKKLPKAVAAKTYVVFVTTDVKHDTGPVIATWLSQFSRNSPATWVGLRGSQAQIDAAQAAAHITVAEDDGKTHSALFLLYGPDDYAHVEFLQSNTQQQQIEHDLPLVAEGKR
ncbi:SCO family protein [uncultured Jatrophihabitans sp.]|uniref:SCO family protein n=1 Tax=uncultured Jatrophihabitans sp. TaxID=1610747 RepID=UPI0035C979B4